MRIRIIVPHELDAAGVEARRALKTTAALGTDVELEPVGTRLDGDTGTELGLTRLAVAVAEAGIAETDGLDAVVVDSLGDPALYALRSRLAIPVVGAGLSAYALALNLGHRFSVVLDQPRWRHAVERSLRLYELLDRCVSVEVAETVGVAPGADVVVRWTERLDREVEVLQVPVLDARLVALQTAERLCRLGLAQSKAAFPAPHVGQDEKLGTLLDAL